MEKQTDKQTVAKSLPGRLLLAGCKYFIRYGQWLKWRGSQGDGDAVPPSQIYGRMCSPTSGIPADAR